MYSILRLSLIIIMLCIKRWREKYEIHSYFFLVLHDYLFSLISFGTSLGCLGIIRYYLTDIRVHLWVGCYPNSNHISLSRIVSAFDRAVELSALSLIQTNCDLSLYHLNCVMSLLRSIGQSLGPNVCGQGLCLVRCLWCLLVSFWVRDAFKHSLEGGWQQQ